MDSKTEITATFSKNGNTIKIAFRSIALFSEGIGQQIAGGWIVIAVEERPRKTYAEAA